MSTAATEQSQSLPRINDPAPDFKGKWVVLFSHPADFTPVCTTEFVEFARRADEFKQRGAQLIGLSVDSVPAHIAWIRNIQDHFGVKVDFPVIADLDTKVSQKYGLIHPGASETATVRAVFVIDPNQKVRALIYYPMSLGRNIDEVVRFLDALLGEESRGRALLTSVNAARAGKGFDPRNHTKQHEPTLPFVLFDSCCF